MKKLLEPEIQNMNNIKSVAVVISTYNRKKYLNTILSQIKDQKVDDLSIFVIVIVDGSTDGTIESVKVNFPDVKLIIGTGNWWWTKCMNEGFKKAIELHADYILVLNDDTEIKPDYISSLWTDYRTLPDCAVLGSASVSIDPAGLIDFAGTRDMKLWCMKTTKYLSELTPLYSDFKGIFPTWTMNGRGSFFAVSLLEKIGMYDEKLVQYGSDDEFALRARKMGFSVYISWNAHVYNNLFMTSEGTAFRKDPFWKFIKSFGNPHSVNSLKKASYLYGKYGVKILTPFYLVYFFIGTIKAYLFKYRSI